MVALGEVVLQAVGIEKYFGTHHVLRGMDLAVRKHETVMIIGRSGTGKTTFLRCLNFLEEPTAGTVSVAGLRVEADPLQLAGRQRRRDIRVLRQRTGMVFQEFNLFPHLSVLENCIEAPMHVKGEGRDAAIATAERYLAKVHMLGKRDEYPDRLSGGQKQRVAIARALSMEPEVLLFDEPTSALDPGLIGEVIVVMEQLAHEGSTMIVVSHELDFAREAADRIIFIDDGVVAEEGPPEQVLDDPHTEACRAFLRRLPGEVARSPSPAAPEPSGVIDELGSHVGHGHGGAG
jgi:polar amino acid transport system ATP-binding protein